MRSAWRREHSASSTLPARICSSSTPAAASRPALGREVLLQSRPLRECPCSARFIVRSGRVRSVPSDARKEVDKRNEQRVSSPRLLDVRLRRFASHRRSEPVSAPCGQSARCHAIRFRVGPLRPELESLRTLKGLISVCSAGTLPHGQLECPFGVCHFVTQALPGLYPRSSKV